MEQEIKINTSESTCDITIKGLPLWRIHNLSAMHEVVAEQMKRALVMTGYHPDWAEEARAKAVDGKLTRQEICPRRTLIPENPRNGHNPPRYS